MAAEVVAIGEVCRPLGAQQAKQRRGAVVGRLVDLAGILAEEGAVGVEVGRPESAELLLVLEDHDPVAGAGQQEGSGHAARSAAHDGHALAWSFA